MYWSHHYVIDWDKVSSLEDIKILLRASLYSFEQDHPLISQMEHFLSWQAKDNDPSITYD